MRLLRRGVCRHLGGGEGIVEVRRVVVRLGSLEEVLTEVFAGRGRRTRKTPVQGRTIKLISDQDSSSGLDETAGVMLPIVCMPELHALNMIRRYVVRWWMSRTTGAREGRCLLVSAAWLACSAVWEDVHR